MKTSGVMVGLLVLTIGCEKSADVPAFPDSSTPTPSAQSPASATALQGSFAFADSTGTQLLAVDSLTDPSTLVGAICSKGTALRVQYDRWQLRQAGDNGRQNANNFANQQGDRFRVVEGSAPANGTCLLVRDPALVASARAVALHEPAACSSALTAVATRLATVRKRQVTSCSSIGTASPGHELAAIQFATVDTNALASIVVVRDTSILVKDFPAVYHKLEESTWRVDDGGVFSPADFDILFVAETPQGYAMAYAWAGAEGQSCEFLVADSNGVFQSVSKGYRYLSPI